MSGRADCTQWKTPLRLMSTTPQCDHLAQPAAERQLPLVVEVQPADQEHPAPLEGFGGAFDEGVVEWVGHAGELHPERRAQGLRFDHGNTPSIRENHILIMSGTGSGEHQVLLSESLIRANRECSFRTSGV
jgi:hypothetical protein